MQPVQFNAVDLKKGMVRVLSRFSFSNINEYNIFWTLNEDGNEIQSGKVEGLSLNPGEAEVIEVPVKDFSPKANSEYWLRLSVQLKEDKNWAKAGHELAKQQFRVPVETPAIANKPTRMANPVIDDSGTNIIVTGKGFKIEIDKSSGLLVNYEKAGDKIIQSVLKPNFWRPLTVNDERGWRAQNRIGVWKDLPQNLQLKSLDIDKGGLSVTAKLGYEELTLDLTYSFVSDGTVEVQYNLNIPEEMPEPIRVGVAMGVSTDLQQMSLYGKGPFENYADRKGAAEVNIYSGTVDDFYYNYTKPQESSNHTCVRWLALTNSAKSGLMVVGKNPVQTSVWPYTAENIREAQHPTELVKADELTVNVSHKMAGVGGNDSWSINARPIDKYRLLEKEYSFGFKLVPVTKAKNLQEFYRYAK
jgi:beta-galactosidase